MKILKDLGKGRFGVNDPGGWHVGRYTDEVGRDLEKDAEHFILPPAAVEPVEAALALGEPLLLTGDPGTGKTQLAYWLALRLGWKRPVRFQVQSGSTARDLRYSFDELGRFHEGQGKPKAEFLKEGPLWTAIRLAEEHGRPAVLLVDEIDKASRDFPNDLLRDLEEMKFTVPELDGQEVALKVKDLRPVVVITSNGERNLPPPLLRRCVCCHLEFDASTLLAAVAARSKDLGELTPEFVALAIKRFQAIRKALPEPKPATGEFLMWLRLLRRLGREVEVDSGPLGKTPGLAALVKTREGREAVARAG